MVIGCLEWCEKGIDIQCKTKVGGNCQPLGETTPSNEGTANESVSLTWTVGNSTERLSQSTKQANNNDRLMTDLFFSL